MITDQLNKEYSDKKKIILSIIGLVISIVSLASAAFHLYISYSTAISVFQQRIIHVFLLILVYYLYAIKDKVSKGNKLYILYVLLAITAIVSAVYYLNGTTVQAMIAKGIGGIGDVDVVFGVILMILILDITRKAIGNALTIIAIIFIIYAFAGPFMPEMIAHKGYKIPYITSYVAWTMEGIFGTPIGASVSFVALYIIFGELLDKFGAGKFFIDVAYALTGRMRGGPAEASVVSSALMGSINGSAVANVVTTGTFTIPLMKKVGYSSTYSGAVEAVASTGGQLLPPVMGAAAFVMADMTGISYSNIILAAFIPGILYYISLGVSVYMEAGKLGLKSEPRECLPKLLKVFKDGWYYLLPIIVLIVALLGYNLSASYAAVFAIFTLLVVGIIRHIMVDRKFPIRIIYNAFVKAARTTVPVAMACAAAGIVIGIVSMTGIGVKFTRIVFELSGGNLFMMLTLIMAACIVMGMGLPATAAYVIAATIGVPPLINAGITPIAANMFVFYFAIMSFITPPVALSAYAASGISESNSMRTGVKAFVLGLAGFIIPFVYAYNPALLILDSSAGAIIYITLITTFAIVLMAIAFTGWLKGAIALPFRLMLMASVILMLLQNNRIFNMAGVIAGIVTLVLIIIYNKKRYIPDQTKTCQQV